MGLESNDNSKNRENTSNALYLRSKGCKKRIKSLKEMVILESRLCWECRFREQSHDKRNDPKLHVR